MDCLHIRLALSVFIILVIASCGGSRTTPSQPGAASQNHTSVLTYHDDTLRTGQNLTEKILTPANVNSSSFGMLFSLSVDGKVDSQPLYVSQLAMPGQGIRSVVYAATEHDSVYAFD